MVATTACEAGTAPVGSRVHGARVTCFRLVSEARRRDEGAWPPGGDGRPLVTARCREAAAGPVPGFARPPPRVARGG
ncbi:hypothetical protein ACL03H_13595 [Saccharopolyspora sp. MS10]|uniref:hypothetical protein n=1 Tax=Saccharopolyspora sp. MS10 TaxID=3385973 RepID=UPI00399F9EC6